MNWTLVSSYTGHSAYDGEMLDTIREVVSIDGTLRRYVMTSLTKDGRPGNVLVAGFIYDTMKQYLDNKLDVDMPLCELIIKMYGSKETHDNV